MKSLWHHLLSVLLTTLSSSVEERSPWAPAEWRVNLQFGRVAGTNDMPDYWGASGAKLLLQPEILLEAKDSTPQDLDVDFFRGARSNELSVLEDASYINATGQHAVRFGNDRRTPALELDEHGQVIKPAPHEPPGAMTLAGKRKR